MNWYDEPQAGGLINPWKWVIIPIAILIIMELVTFIFK